VLNQNLRYGNCRVQSGFKHATEFENNTLSLVPFRKPIDYKWVFRVKENVDGSYNKYTTKFVAKRFQQNKPKIQFMYGCQG